MTIKESEEKYGYDINEEIECHGPRPRPDLVEEADKDIRPCWLVVTSAHFNPREVTGGEDRYRFSVRRVIDPKIKKQMEAICR